MSRKVEYKVEDDDLRMFRYKKWLNENGNNDNWVELGYRSWDDYMRYKLNK